MVAILTRIPLVPTAEAERPPPAVGDVVRGVRYGGLLEVKADAWRVEGFASAFLEVDAQGDEVQPGAFLESLTRNPRPPLLWAHDPSRVIGVAERLQETADGLWGRWRLSKTREGADVRQLLLDKAVDGLSIGFQCGPGDWEHVGGVRKLKRIRLYEVSVVAMPAATGARVTGVKSLPVEPASYLAAFLERQRGRTELENQKMQADILRLRLPVLTAARGEERLTWR